ncbi:hypothetical protein NCPPB3923_28415 [Burkholderia glumae]|nr:hypothetical protein NCPPB3923_28415 [Burkholderia glumae]
MRFMPSQHGLLRLALHCYLVAGLLDGKPDCPCIRRVVLVTDVECLGKARGHETDLVSELAERSCPVLEPPQASMPIKQGSRLAKYSRKLARLSGLLMISPLPVAM